MPLIIAIIMIDHRINAISFIKCHRLTNVRNVVIFKYHCVQSQHLEDIYIVSRGQSFFFSPLDLKYHETIAAAVSPNQTVKFVLFFFFFYSHNFVYILKA